MSARVEELSHPSSLTFVNDLQAELNHTGDMGTWLIWSPISSSSTRVQRDNLAQTITNRSADIQIGSEGAGQRPMAGAAADLATRKNREVNRA